MNKIVTMFSFKGGSGRTVSSGNIASILVKECRKSVVYIDMDTESMGAVYLFKMRKELESRGSKVVSIHDILRQSWPEGLQSDGYGQTFHPYTEFTKYWPHSYFTILEEKEAYLRLVPGNITTRCRGKDNPSPNKNSSAARLFQLFISGLDDICEDSPDITILDSAAGIQDPASLSIGSSNVLVIYMRWTGQFVYGTEEYLRSYLLKAVEDSDLIIKAVFIVPTAVPTVAPGPCISDDIQRRCKWFNERVSDVRERLKKRGVILEVLPEIPESPDLRWEDAVLLQRDNLEDFSETTRVDVLNAYRNIAKRIIEV